MKFQVYWRVGSDLRGVYGYSLYDTDIRLMFEPSKFEDGTPVYFETSAALYAGETGTDAAVFLHDMGAADQGAAEVQVDPQTITVTDGVTANWTDGAGVRLDASYPGGWTDEWLEGAKDAFIVFSAADTASMTAGSFDDSVIPAGSVINTLRALATVGTYGQGAGTTYGLGGGNVSGAESEYLPPPPEYTLTLYGITRTLASTVIPATVALSVTQANATETIYGCRAIYLMAGLSIDVAASELVPTLARTRLRTTDLSAALTENNRYIVHWSIPDGTNDTGHSQSFLIYDVEGDTAEPVVRAGERVIEYFMPQELFHQIEDAFFVHCGLTWDGGDAVEITAITNANPAVVTAPGHALQNGDFVRISDVLGMTEINNTDETSAYIVEGVSGDTFQLSGINSTNFGVFAGGSTVEKVTNHVIGLITSIYYTGRTIRALGDGTHEYNGDLTADGEVTFPWYANKIHVGLPFSTVLEPMNPNAGSQQGTARTKKQKINRAGLCFYETVNCKVGINETLAYEIPAIDSDAAATGVPHFVNGELLSDDLIVDLRGEWEDKATIYIEHDHATPFTLKAVIPRQNTDDES